MTASPLLQQLPDVPVGARSTIVAIAEDAPQHIALRLRHLGFRAGNVVDTIRVAPLGDPVAYRILGYEMCLRCHEARHIQVVVTA